MTSPPHASGPPQSQPASRSGSRHKDSFPPPPKSVRIWEVQAHGQDDTPPAPASPDQTPTDNRSCSKCTLNRTGWVLLFLAALVVLAACLFACLFVCQLK